MNTQTTDIQTSKISTIYPETIVGQDVYYPSELEKEVGETTFHYKLIFLLYGLLEPYFAGRKDVMVAANLMVISKKAMQKNGSLLIFLFASGSKIIIDAHSKRGKKVCSRKLFLKLHRIVRTKTISVESGLIMLGLALKNTICSTPSASICPHP